jgi:hypothetical protein
MQYGNQRRIDMITITGRVLTSKEIRGLRSGILLKVNLTGDQINSHIGQERYVFVPMVLATSSTYQPVLFEFVEPSVFRAIQERAQSKELPENNLQRVYSENARFNLLVTFSGDLEDPWDDLGDLHHQVLVVSEVPVIDGNGQRKSAMQ